MPRLGLVAAGRQRRERALAEEPHPVLRVADSAARDELEQALRRPVREPPAEGHRPEIAEAVADDEVGAAAGRQETWDSGRGVLAVGVDEKYSARR